MFAKLFGDAEDAVVVLRQLNEDDEPSIYVIVDPQDGSDNLTEMVLIFESVEWRDAEFDEFTEDAAFKARDLVREVSKARKELKPYKGPM
jgi:hypothetical protein